MPTPRPGPGLAAIAPDDRAGCREYDRGSAGPPARD